MFEDRVPAWFAIRPGLRAIGILTSVVLGLVAIWPLLLSGNEFDVGVVGLVSEPVVAGGESITQPPRILDQVMRFRGRLWHVEPMLVPRHAMSLAPYAGRQWACGGADQVNTVSAVSNCTSIGR